MNITGTQIIILIISIIAVITILFLFKKIVKILLITIITAGVLYYIFIFSNIFNDPNQHSKYSIDYFKDYFGKELITHNDSVLYFTIIVPIYNSIKSTYTETELLEIEKDPIKYSKILNEAIKKNKKKIIKNLARNGEQRIWDKFIYKLKTVFLISNNQHKVQYDSLTHKL